MSKRKCIFTGKESDYLAQLGEDKHNWAKRIPCTREWWDANKDRPLTPNEFRLVELFFEQEIARLKVDNIEEQMQRIRDGRVIILETEEWDKLQEYLENPPPPTPAFVEAMKRYKREFSPQTITEEEREQWKKDEHGINYIDEPEDMNTETAKKIMEMPPIKPENAEINILTTPTDDDKVKKKVVKKKPTLWD